MSYKAWDWARRMPVGGVRRHVLFELVSFHNHKTGRCNPSLEEIAEQSGLGVTTVRSHLRGLEAAGIIATQQSNGGRRKRSSYTLRFDFPVSADAETRQELPGRDALETRQELPRDERETRQEPRENPAGAADVGLRPKTGTREQGTTRRAAGATRTADGGLFEAPQPKPSAEVANINDRPLDVNGGTAVAAWCDGYRESFPDCQPTSEQTGRVGRSAKQLLKANNPKDKVVYAAWSAGTKGFLDVQREYQFLSRRRGGGSSDTRVPVTETRVNGALALAAMYDQQDGKR